MKKPALTLFVTAALALAGCGPATAPDSPQASAASGAAAVKKYPMHGKVISVDPGAKSARIDAGPIGDWMPTAMTMNYVVKDSAVLAKLAAGETIDATVSVQGDDSWISDVTPSK